jgi:hypothetical protein
MQHEHEHPDWSEDEHEPGQGYSVLSNEEMEAVQRHVELYVGRNTDVLHESESEVVHLDLLPVEFEDEDRRALFLCTMGMSAMPMNFADAELEGEGLVPSPYAELCVALPADWPYHPEDFERDGDESYWPFGWLKMIARATLASEGFIGSGLCVPNQGEPPEPFTPSCRFVAMLILPADLLAEGLSRMEHNDKQVDFYMLAPIYAEELELLEEKGLEALIELLEESGIAPWDLADPTRPSAVAGS